MRIFALGAIFATGYGILLCRAVVFHLKDNEALERVAMRQYRTAVRQSTWRGKIVDAMGRDLAVNIPVESIYANPRGIADPQRFAAALGKVLNLDAEKLEQRLSSSRKFVWVKRHIIPKEAEAIRKLGLEGIFSMNESRRSYPNGRLASTVLGAVGFDTEALGGVELAFHDVLVSTSTPGEYRRDARGHLYLSPTDYTGERKLAEVQLTIDSTIQYIAERELGRALETTRARGGVAIVVDPMTGEILAMASLPAFDPNDYARYDTALWRNRAITDAFEPGSTFKVMVVAAALNAGRVAPDEVIDCQHGEMIVGNKTIHDTHAYGKLPVDGIIQVSSNIGAAKIGQRLSRESLYEAMRAFGFGKTLSVGLPGESGGILPSAASWSELSHMTIAFGQGISATPLQMTMAFAAIANGGELLKPQIVKRIVTAEQEEMASPKRTVLDRPTRPEIARLMLRMLEAVTKQGGTGTLAASNEYPMAGKTGTAQKADPLKGGYAEGKYYASFIGIAPADTPRLVVYVGIDEPSAGAYYGGQIAAPVVRRIVEGALHYLKVPASLHAPLPPAEKVAPMEATQTNGDQERVRVMAAGGGNFRIPNFQGLSMRSVLEAVGRANIDIRLHGSGIAVDQQPAPGTVVPSGAQCVVTFRSLL